MRKPYTIPEIKNKITCVAQQYGIQRAYVFGSYARGDATYDSDIDICIEKGKIRTLFQFSGFCQDLEESLENKIDVITTTGMSSDFKEKIEKDMILVYG
ncbi:MAG: nucleotidyltransferase domain-containing protein [Treponema sp.]|nr:nucleotidyltransferase domain-containing protein [Treponema sp.]